MGRCGRICSIVKGAAPGLRPTPKTLGVLKTIVIMILMAGVAVLATSRRNLLRMHYACKAAKQQSEPSDRREGDRPDRPKKDHERKTPKPEEKQKGLGANPGHK